jgi:cytochrome P450
LPAEAARRSAHTTAVPKTEGEPDVRTANGPCNRDETAFETPHQFDVRREQNPHQGFGGGRHFCLGAGLARLELRLWIEETLRRFPTIDLDVHPERLTSTFLNQYRTIPVQLAS